MLSLQLRPLVFAVYRALSARLYKICLSFIVPQGAISECLCSIGD